MLIFSPNQRCFEAAWMTLQSGCGPGRSRPCCVLRVGVLPVTEQVVQDYTFLRGGTSTSQFGIRARPGQPAFGSDAYR